MAYSASIGRCVAVSSPIHRADARVKAVALIVLSLLSFFIADVRTAVFMGVLAVALIVLSRIPPRVFWRTVRPFIVLMVFGFVVNALVLQGGPQQAVWGPITITMRGVQTGALVAYRTMAALAFGVLLVGTTTPVALCDALESLLRPLRVFGLPYQDVAMIFSIALRYIPQLAEEAGSVVDAQKSRGAAALDGTLAQRAKTYASLVVPLLSSSMRHAERLATALESRCWAAEDVRTHLAVHRMGAADAAFALCMAAAIIVFCFLAF